MQIRNLLKELETCIEKSKGFGHWRIVDEQKLSVLLRRIEVALPSELRVAEEIIRERDKRIRAAQEEAERIIREAEEEKQRILERAQREAERRIAESEIVKSAEQRADELLRRAEERAGETRQQAVEEALRRKAEALEYALKVLNKLEQTVNRLREIIIESREELEREKIATSLQEPSAGHRD